MLLAVDAPEQHHPDVGIGHPDVVPLMLRWNPDGLPSVTVETSSPDSGSSMPMEFGVDLRAAPGPTSPQGDLLSCGEHSRTRGTPAATFQRFRRRAEAEAGRTNGAIASAASGVLGTDGDDMNRLVDTLQLYLLHAR